MGSIMEIREVVNNKAEFMPLLLIGDEDELMVGKYLECSKLYALYEDNVLVSVCALVIINSDTIEIKNLATYPKYQNRGYASKLLNFVFDKYKDSFRKVILGTGENDITLNFYKKRGFRQTRRVKNFFVDNYPHPIFENGKQLVDMIYLEKSLFD